MLVRKGPQNEERHILVGMITDKKVLSAVSSAWTNKAGLFGSRYANLVGKWCVGYYQKYNRPPKQNIKRMFEQWAAKNDDEATCRLVERLLTQASKSYKQEVNADYIIDRAAEHFKMIQLTNHAEGLQQMLEVGNVQGAEQAVSSFTHVRIADHGWLKMDELSEDTVADALDMSKRKSLIEYDEALQHFFGSALERDAFIAIMAAEKRGKTWWLVDMAVRASMQGRRVMFFEAGDQSQRQLLRRLHVRTCCRPMTAKTIRYPKGIDNLEGIEVTHGKKTFADDLDTKLAMKRLQKLRNLRVACYPNSTLTAAIMRSDLEAMESEDGWTPDIIITDYADIMAPAPGFEGRDAINQNWQQLRRLSQERHCLVLTATQADSAAYAKETLDQSNFSEDKRKFAHVTGMFALNASTDEKTKGIQRINWVVLREAEFDLSKCCYVTGCLDIGNPAMHSTF